MRIKTLDDVNKLGANAKRQVQAAIDHQGGINNIRRITGLHELGSKVALPHNKEKAPQLEDNTNAVIKKKEKPSRVMRTDDDRTYCPWPSTDPFVAVVQRLEAKYGIYEDGGMLLTELIVDGGHKNWRFDIALISPFQKVDIVGRKMYLGYTCLVEADGFGFHRSKEAFKNDRAKQTHALKQGFAVKRITNEDARHRLDEVVEDIEKILSQPRLYEDQYIIFEKGKTQSVLRWDHSPENVTP